MAPSAVSTSPTQDIDSLPTPQTKPQISASVLNPNFFSSQNPSSESPRTSLPAKNQFPSPSWDTHVHIFSPTTHPFSPTRAYTPAPAQLSSLLTFTSSLPLPQPTNLVLVQPSPYGTDNSLILSVLESQRSAEDSRQFRAIVVLDVQSVEIDELRRWHGLGVRGVRINVEASGEGVEVGALKRRIGEVVGVLLAAGLGDKWVIQLFIAGKLWDDLYETIRSLPVRIIADHQGGMKGPSSLPPALSPLSQPGLASLVSLAKSGHVYVKISGLYRSSTLTIEDHADMQDLVTYFAEQIPDRLVWGSDWPHTGSGAERKLRESRLGGGLGQAKEIVEGFRSVNIAKMVSNVRSWVGEEVWQRMIVETPTELFA